MTLFLLLFNIQEYCLKLVAILFVQYQLVEVWSNCQINKQTSPSYSSNVQFFFVFFSLVLQLNYNNELAYTLKNYPLSRNNLTGLKLIELSVVCLYASIIRQRLCWYSCILEMGVSVVLLLACKMFLKFFNHV